MENLYRSPKDRNKYYLKENGAWENYYLRRLLICDEEQTTKRKIIKGYRWEVYKYIPAVLDKNGNMIEDSKIITIAIRSNLRELDKRLTIYKKDKVPMNLTYDLHN